MSLPLTLGSRVVEIAKSWIGTPYHMGAKLKGIGVDCGTLVTEVYREAGVISEDIELGHFSHDWFLHTREERYLERVNRYCVPDDHCSPGNLVVLQYGRVFAHGGIIIEWPVAIHAWNRGVGYTDVLKLGRVYRIYEPLRHK